MTTIRILDDIRGKTKTLESPKSREEVIGGLTVACLEQKKDDLIRFCLHLYPDMVCIHWWSRPGAEDLALAVLNEGSRPGAVSEQLEGRAVP